ncbi:1-acyl-sn-glycerol-3-phosphate acyltransferase [Streptosporangium sp. NBC_01639]|uniref:1-acyl-sn-glycerol-3-phosphate acyltransferase n=1 Tax=unclassified Streptosporangium TaxID=2632669 RepID=UPI002DD99E36|nr:1-acyl-sn-glycerol-3-phosphate acyltransferase [Streptosporangium sp. NBC_01756]WSC88239.1 1-acyl-sn-glycerol-3-phosphate acyltransferase [Streptosporangium sp. NBC_01756]WTD53084.1 1-acyl-sn-glycerol-3-phosphate acyltransferase [Streptosporangium sp. NBC_01639]
MLPPRFLRRLILAPLVIVLAVAVVITLPVWLLVVAAASLRLPPPQRRGTRLVWFAVAWLTLETMALVACFGIWVTSGFGGRLSRDEYEERQYALIRWFLAKVYAAAERIFGLRVEVDGPPPVPDELARRLARPVIVLSRHAGPGDSVLLVHHLLSVYGRRPRIVMKAALQLDPSLDVLTNRLPNAFVPRNVDTRGIIAEIRRLASDMDADDALVIFPEGGNFTPRRQARAIRRLERKGLAKEAARARRLNHLLAPHPGGAVAAIDACPAADVVFVAHTGLDDLVTLGDLWRKLPVRAEVRATWWRVDAADVPRDEEGRIRWLYDHWERIDAWITENHRTPATEA